jgi:hypothetical protein
VKASVGYVEVSFEGDRYHYSLLWEPRDGYLEVYIREPGDTASREETLRGRCGDDVPELRRLDWDTSERELRSRITAIERLLARVAEGRPDSNKCSPERGRGQ